MDHPRSSILKKGWKVWSLTADEYAAETKEKIASTRYRKNTFDIVIPPKNAQ
jgi:hypothetical protein